jgi:hypothetical protein
MQLFLDSFGAFLGVRNGQFLITTPPIESVWIRQLSLFSNSVRLLIPFGETAMQQQP